MKIYLLSIDDRRFFFYADESEADREEGAGPGSSGPAAAGLWGRLQERLHQLKATWGHSESRVVVWTRQAWDWLHSWAHPDELMLARLRSARRIELHYPATRPVDQVRALWRDYLTRRWWRHLTWMGINAVIAPFTIFLALLPGPNVVGYWFAYRAIHHALIVWGIRRVLRNRLPIEWHPQASLEQPIERDADGRAMHAALREGAALLDEHVAWSETESIAVIAGGARRAAAAPAGERPPTPGPKRPETGDHATPQL